MCQTRLLKNIYCRIVLATCVAVVICATQGPVAAPLPGDGGYLKVGLGYSPYARTALDIDDIAVTSNGVSPSIVAGLVWGRRNSLDIRWQTILLDDSRDNRQGFLGLTYTRYLRKHGPSPFFDIGFGFQHGPLVVSNTRANFETNDGFGFTIGAGLRFSKRLEVAADFGVGSTGRFFSSNNTFDFSHQQLTFSLRYTLLGG
jgi:hypothetical protein